MSEIQFYEGGGALTRDTRRAARAISRSRSAAQVRLSRVDDEADVAIQKVEALTSTTGMSMGAVTRVAQAQKHLETLAPEVTGRLSYLADSHLMAVADSLQDLRRSLRCK